MRAAMRALLAPLLFPALPPAHAAAQAAAPPPPPAAGIARGWLVLDGGGHVAGTASAARFVALAGGPDRTFVAIPTAISDDQWLPDRLARCARRTAEMLRVAHVTCVDVRGPDEADDDAFAQAFRSADGVWIYGGDERRLVDRYAGTGAAAALRGVLERGGVVGGSSAGAMILASFTPSRASRPVSGLGFLPNATIEPHYTQGGFAGHMRRVVSTHPGMLGIGIDEHTAVVVHGASCEVVGEGTVTLMGPRTAVLHAGDHCDLGAAAPGG